MTFNSSADAHDLQNLWAEAQRHASHENWQSARGVFNRLLLAFPGHAPSLIEMSYVESFLGHYRSARECALRAYETSAGWPEILSDLIARLRTFNEAPLLLELSRKLLGAGSRNVPVLFDLAAQLSHLNVQQEALSLLNAARKIDRSNTAIPLLRAQVLIFLGRLDEAEDELNDSLSRTPSLAHAYWLLSLIRTQTPTRNHIPGLQEQLRKAAGKPSDTALLCYALHKEHDDLGNVSLAWSALEAGCTAKRSLLAYDPVGTASLVDQLVGVRSAAPSSSSTRSRTPIFIVGMHRSGTTLLEQLLDGHSNVRGIGELYDFTSQMRYATDHHCRGVIDAAIVERSKVVDFDEVERGYLAGIEWRLGAERFFTDKLPSNFLNIGFICQALPQAKILHMVRDPVETCFSNLRELFSDANPYSYDQIELADYFLQYQRLMRHWHAAYPGRILDVDYARLTRQPERVLRDVSAFCGFEFEPAMLDLMARTRGVATASAVQVRGKVVARETPKWAPYAEYLEPMIGHLRAGGAIS